MLGTAWCFSQVNLFKFSQESYEIRIIILILVEITIITNIDIMLYMYSVSLYIFQLVRTWTPEANFLSWNHCFTTY